MATKIGKWGSDITFSVSSKKLLTFNSLKRTVSGRYKSHAIVGKVPLLEFAGPEASTVEISEVMLTAYHGIKPRKMLEKLEKAVTKGKAEYLFIGGKKIGSNKFVLESISETWDEIWNKGELVSAKVDLSFREYKEDGTK